MLDKTFSYFADISSRMQYVTHCKIDLFNTDMSIVVGIVKKNYICKK